MQALTTPVGPLELRIPGDYWDSFLYRKRLYLWRMDGSVAVYDWDQLVEETLLGEDARLASSFGFLRGRSLYTEAVADLVQHTAVMRELAETLRRACSTLWEVHDTTLRRAELGRHGVPHNVYHADAEIYSGTLFTSGEDGLFSATTGPRLKYGVSTRPKRLWDAPIFGLDIYNGRIALGAGSEGLFECPTKDYARETIDPALKKADPSSFIAQITNRPCHSPTWIFSSALSSYPDGRSYLAGFVWEDAPRTRTTHGKRLKFLDSFETSSIFDHDGYDFGESGFLYRAAQSGDLTRAHLVQKDLDQGLEKAIDKKDKLHSRRHANRVVSAGAMTYGLAIETDDNLDVLRSDDHITRTGEPVTKWRRFPRSRYYSNQLHAVLNDEVRVYGFLHDYFVAQDDSKSFGFPNEPRSLR